MQANLCIVQFIFMFIVYYYLKRDRGVCGRRRKVVCKQDCTVFNNLSRTDELSFPFFFLFQTRQRHYGRQECFAS